jgi:hypothetical protein
MSRQLKTSGATMMGAVARGGLVAFFMLAGALAVADTGSFAPARAASQAAYDGFRELLKQNGPEHGLPETSDPTVVATLAAVWDSDFLQVPKSVRTEDLENLDKICLNGMIVWKTYLFDGFGGLNNFEEKFIKRLVRYQAAIGPGLAFSIRCADLFIIAYEAAPSESAIDQEGAYNYWVDKERGWIVSSLAIICAGIFTDNNSRPVGDALHAVLPGQLASDRQTFDRDAFLNSARDAMAQAAAMPGTRGLKGCGDLKALLARAATDGVTDD